MKRLLEITLFSFLIMGILSSGTTKKNIRSILHSNASLALKVDTTNLINHLEVDSFRLDIIPPSFGVQFYKDGIIFLSMTKLEGKMSASHISFGAVEAYYASIKDTVLGRHTIFSPYSSFSYPCEAMSFSHDYNTLYFTRLSKKDTKEKIYMAKLTPNSKNQTDWVTQASPLEFCTDNSSYTHPALSADEKMMVFASDKAGSVGGMDLFFSKRVGDKWSALSNLGKLINTTGNEFFPFLDSENNLYFSSDGLPGFGGYDIFTCKFDGETWEKPENLTSYINSDNDDVAFTINKMDEMTAFFTRKQKSGEGEMQLFKVKLKEDTGYHNLMTLSYIFNGKPAVKSSLTASTKSEVKPVMAEPIKTKPGVGVIKKEDVISHETIDTLKKLPEKKAIIRSEPGVSPTDNKSVTIKTAKPAVVEQKNEVIYRIQLLVSTNQKNNKEVIINGKSYKLYEYFYLGAARYTIGEFSTLKAAVELQRICRESGYPQSFVIVFVNNTRSLDPKLFK
jgi:WD40-like Beta Propeller Repeat